MTSGDVMVLVLAKLKAENRGISDVSKEYLKSLITEAIEDLKFAEAILEGET